MFTVCQVQTRAKKSQHLIYTQVYVTATDTKCLPYAPIQTAGEAPMEREQQNTYLRSLCDMVAGRDFDVISREELLQHNAKRSLRRGRVKVDRQTHIPSIVQVHA